MIVIYSKEISLVLKIPRKVLKLVLTIFGGLIALEKESLIKA